MDRLIENPLWAVVGVVFTALAVLVPILIFFAQRKVKRLSFEVLSSTQLLGIKEEIQGKVRVLYDGQEVKNVHLLTLKFLNSGNQPIASVDYENPLQMYFGEQGRVLTCEIIQEDPPGLDVNGSVEESRIIFSPTLLNVKDSFSVKVLISDYLQFPKISGRINGVRSISKYKEGLAAIILAVCFSFAVLIVALFFVSSHDSSNETMVLFGLNIPRNILGITLFAISYSSLLIGTIKNKRLRSVFKLMSANIISKA